MAVIGIDFNGTVVTYDYPHAIGREIGATPVLRRLVKVGHELILVTAINPAKNDANFGVPNLYDRMLDWFKDRGIPLLGVNHNPYADPNEFPPGNCKTRADLYIDDHMLGAPLWNDQAISDRPFLDWQAVEEMLEDYGYLPEMRRSMGIFGGIHFASPRTWSDEYRYYDWALNPQGFSPDVLP